MISIISEPVSSFARLPSMMVMDRPQASFTRAEAFPTSAQTATAHSTPFPPQHDGAHIKFRGGSSEYAPQHDADEPSDHGSQHSNATEPQTAGHVPPPSPRLEPTHRSTLSLNGSTASSPSRIKVRDLGHIQSFASEEVLTRSRHPSKHSLRGRISGGQQYEISAMPVADIIEMVAGLLTKITSTVIGSRSKVLLC